MEIIVIAAMAANRVIGNEGKIPWHLPEDLHHFKQTTMGHPLVMGRKTFESIGAALPGRRTVVISRDQTGPAPGCDTVASLEEALRLLENEEKVFVAGGGEVYQQALPLADAVVLTVLDQSYCGDTYFPELSEESFCLQEERKLAGRPDCTVKIFKRCSPETDDAKESSFEVKVDCYSGYRGEETPRRFRLGSRRVEVQEVLDRWLAPDHRYFKVRGDDRAIYILRHDVEHDRWQVTLFSQRSDFSSSGA
jgi:dihydrofolate reductase